MYKFVNKSNELYIYKCWRFIKSQINNNHPYYTFFFWCDFNDVVQHHKCYGRQNATHLNVFVAINKIFLYFEIDNSKFLWSMEKMNTFYTAIILIKGYLETQIYEIIIKAYKSQTTRITSYKLQQGSE